MSGFQGIKPPQPSSVRERVDKVIEKLKERGATGDNCVRCGVFDWSVDFLQIPASPVLAGTYIIMGPQSALLPVVCFVCKNCGYTMFHNLEVLEKPR